MATVTFSSSEFWKLMLDVITGSVFPSGSTQLLIYSGNPPTDPSLGATSNGAVQLGFTSSAFPGNIGTSVGGVIALATPISITPNVSGTIAWGRYGMGGGNAAFDVDITLDGDGGGLIFDTLTATSGVPLNFTNMQVELPLESGTFKMSLPLVNSILESMFKGSATPSINSGGTLIIYDGSVPANITDAATGNILDTISPTSLWSAPTSGGSMVINPTNQAQTADVSGTPSYFRLTKGLFVIQGTCGASGTNMVLDSGTLTSGVGYNINELTISKP